MSFALQLAAFAAKAGDRAEQVVADVVLEIGSRLVLRSPVDTGRFRSNWFVSRGGPMAGVTDKLGGGLNGIDQLAGKSVGTVFYIQNNLPYAWRLEMGHSNQAPLGMVGITLAEFDAIVDGAARKANP